MTVPAAVPRDPGGRARRIVRRRLDEARDPPVHDEHLAERADHDVLGLQVAVDHAVRVRERDGIADALEDAEALRQRHARRERVEPRSVDPLHRVEDAAVRQRAGVVDGNDPRMLEPRDDARLAQHPLRGRGIGDARGDDLERDLPSEDGVVGEVDRAHPSVTQLLENPVLRVGEVRPLRDAPQMLDGGARQPPHGATPRRLFASSRNSRSLEVISRSFSSTMRRNSRRANARKLVTCVAGMWNSSASFS